METRIGTVRHYWPKAHAASLDLEGADLHLGDRIRIRGRDHDFTQQVTSIEIDHQRRGVMHAADDAAILVKAPVHAHDEVFLIENPKRE